MGAGWLGGRLVRRDWVGLPAVRPDRVRLDSRLTETPARWRVHCWWAPETSEMRSESRVLSGGDLDVLAAAGVRVEEPR